MDKGFITINFSTMDNLNLSHKELIVLKYIDSMCTTGVQDYCFASNKTICNTLNITQRTLYRILNRLEEKRLITRKTRSIGNDGKERRIFSNHSQVPK